ncbi:MAG: nodulation protein NodU [Christensenellaceae bacterium]|jgi:hypothetical protein|nr:nodulation protein NodU [Christensenellaceae bacterium]
MDDGYYLSTYTHIDSLGHLYRLSLRHDQSMALWKKDGEKIRLIRYWEFERISGLKKHDLSFYSQEQACTAINTMLLSFGLSLKDMQAVWGTPGLELVGQISYYNSENPCPLHSLCHLFSGMLTDSETFYKKKILALALDGGPDNVIDQGAREKQFYWGAFVDRGGISYFEVPSPGAFWSLARFELGMEEGSMMALGSAVTSHLPNEKSLAAKAPIVLNGKGFDAAYRWLKKIIEVTRMLSADEILEYDPRFSLEDNQIGIIIKVIQRASFNILEDIVAKAVKQYNLDPSEVILSMSGGFALNCPANSHLMKKFGFQSFQTCPCVSDSGIALGMGLFEFYAQMETFQFRLENAYYGCEDRRTISELTNMWGCYIHSVSTFDREKFVVDLTSSPLIWFDGAAEIGPRALGARSILGDPRTHKTKDRLNEVKQREWWRPVAPIVLDQEQHNWFENAFSSPYMLCTSKVKAEKAKQVVAALHLDRSVRLQSIKQENNPRLYDAILAFYEATGIPLICNTSLNDKGEPIIDLFEECINFALRKCIFIVYFNGMRIELKNSEKYSKKEPLLRNILLFDPLNKEDIETAKKQWNPHGLTHKQVDLYLNIPEFRNYDIRSEKDVRMLVRILAQWARLNDTVWKAMLT